MKQISIISTRYAKLYLKDIAKGSLDCWYLSDDYLSFQALRHQVAQTLEIKTMGEEFEVVARSVKSELLSISELLNSRNLDLPYFWGTQIASRSVTSGPLFNVLIYFHFALRLLNQSSDRNLVIISDSPIFIRLLSERARQSKLSVSSKTLLDEKFDWFKIWAKMILRSIFFSLTFIYEWFIFRSLANERIDAKSRGEIYLIRSWVTAGNVSAEGKYIDRNFGQLIGYLEQNCEEVWVMPMFFNLNRTLREQVRLMAKSKTKFLFPQQYLGILSLLKVLAGHFRSIFIRRCSLNFAGVDIFPLVKYYHLREILSPQLMKYNLCYELFRVLSKKSVSIKKFIYPMENNTTEKLCLKGATTFFPSTTTVGFQHSVWYREQLAMCLIPEELKFHPLPQKIVATGRVYLEVLPKCGFPSDRIVLGPSLRFADIRLIESAQIELGQRNLLLILNYDLVQSFEILEKLQPALLKIEFDKFVIKPHPLTNRKDLTDFLKKIGFPNYSFAEGSVSDEVANSNLVIIPGGSISILEAIVAGVPVIRVYSANRFNLNPLWDECPLISTAFSSEDVELDIKKCLEATTDELQALKAFGATVRDTYFEGITPQNMELFRN